MKLVVRVLILVGAACLCSAQIEQPTSGPLLEKPNMAKMFKWFDGLDFEAVHTGQFVRLRSNSFGPDDARFEYGFEVSPTKILTLNLNDSCMYDLVVPDGIFLRASRNMPRALYGYFSLIWLNSTAYPCHTASN